MIKLICFRAISIVYLFGTMLVLLLAIAGTFMMSEGPIPIWVYFILYPLAVILCASQEKCLSYLENKIK